MLAFDPALLILKNKCREVLNANAPGSRNKEHVDTTMAYLRMVNVPAEVMVPEQAESLKKLCQGMRLLTIEPNTLLFVQGQGPSSYFITFSGSIDIRQTRDAQAAANILNTYGENIFKCLGPDFSKNSLGTHLVRLPENKGFGEEALLSGATRAASAVALWRSEVIEICSELYSETLKPLHAVKARVAQSFEALRNHELAQGIPEHTLTTVAYGMCLVKFTEREKICKEKNPIEHLYLVSSGQVKELKLEKKVQVEVDIRGKDTLIGGLEFLKGIPVYQNTYVALTVVEAFTLSLSDFKKLWSNSENVKKFMQNEKLRRQQLARNKHGQSSAQGPYEKDKRQGAISSPCLGEFDTDLKHEGEKLQIVQKAKTSPSFCEMLTKGSKSKRQAVYAAPLHSSFDEDRPVASDKGLLNRCASDPSFARERQQRHRKSSKPVAHAGKNSFTELEYTYTPEQLHGFPKGLLEDLIGICKENQALGLDSVKKVNENLVSKIASDTCANTYNEKKNVQSTFITDKQKDAVQKTRQSSGLKILMPEVRMPAAKPKQEFEDFIGTFKESQALKLESDRNEHTVNEKQVTAFMSEGLAATQGENVPVQSTLLHHKQNDTLKKMRSNPDLQLNSTVEKQATKFTKQKSAVQLSQKPALKPKLIFNYRFSRPPRNKKK